MNGKGDKRRPRQVGHDEYAANWDAVFGPRFEVGQTIDPGSLPDETQRMVLGFALSDIEREETPAAPG